MSVNVVGIILVLCFDTQPKLQQKTGRPMSDHLLDLGNLQIDV
jgi:hypothetical protein